MSLTYFFDIISGFGMFIYGMNLLSDSLRYLSGGNIHRKLKQFTASPIKGVLFGSGVTCIMQSSTATTMMCAGLLNSGVICTQEALPIIMGANIGTTVTCQLLRLGELSETNPILYLLKPSGFSPFFVLIGAIEKLFLKSKDNKKTADIFIGLGLIFIGMELMENGVTPLAQSVSFRQIFLSLQNPMMAVLFGAVMTAVIQSSSVTVGILQSLTVTDAITFSAAFPIILGITIGKVLPEFIATLGGNKNTARTIFADLAVNLTGVLIALFIIYNTEAVIDIPFRNSPATRGMIANIHTAFNIFTAVTMLPFYKRFIILSEKVIC